MSVSYHEGLIERLKDKDYFNKFIAEIIEQSEKAGFDKAVEMMRAAFDKARENDFIFEVNCDPFEFRGAADWLEEQWGKK